MPGKQKHHPAQSPSSRYSNKDGSKFISIPKASTTDSVTTTETMAQINTKTNAQTPAVPSDSNLHPAPNRKKAKRREKLKATEAAAKQVAEHQAQTSGNGISNQARPNPLRQDDYDSYEQGEGDRPYYSDEDGDEYSGSYGRSNSANGFAAPSPSSKTSKKKKRKGQQHEPPDQSHPGQSSGSSTLPVATMSKEKIWNTSSQEERERIKAFWLSLGEEERRSLVKVEKDAVLKKMKEQQKHSCSCSVCGRKRVAIEEELEVLYDAYYDELEQYAHRQGSGPPPMLSGSQRFGQISGLQPPNRLPPSFDGPRPSRGRITEHFDNDEEEEEDDDYSDVEGRDEDDYDDDDVINEEDIVSQTYTSHATDFFNFGQSLTVKGGILTVADDLLKNDGKKFIEMMEQLAERRMAREEDAQQQYTNGGYQHPQNGMAPHSHSHNHNHPPVPEDEDEYDSQEDEEAEYESDDGDYDEEEMETMTEEQRMEEGRRMFQIFAARMFEQRVLSAYKEKVAAERQNKLIQEEDEEANAAEAKRAKKARDAAKKKEKAQAKKQALAEEKAKREAEKAAQEAAAREAEAKKIEEQRQKNEEKRKKREAQKKAEEEDRLRKEAEKQRRLQEQRDREAEQQRKAREAKERDRKEKEEARLREKQAKEAKEKEARDKKEKLEKEKKDSEAKSRADKSSTDRSKSYDQPPPAVPTQIAKRPTPQAPVPLPPGVAAHSIASPQIPVATPVLPKAPTPQRQASSSQKDPISIPQTPQVGSNTSSSTSPHPTTPQQSSPGPLHPGKTSQPFLHHPQATSPIHAALKPGAFPPSPFAGMQPMNGFPTGVPMGFGGRMHHDPMVHPQGLGNQFRPMGGPNGMPIYPGMNGMPIPQGRGFPLQHGPPGFPNQVPHAGVGQYGSQPESGPPGGHSRQQSGSFENTPVSTQPIARPAPIGRPSSTQGHRPGDNAGGRNDMEDLSNHLGSSALLDPDDEPLGSAQGARRSSGVPTGLARQGGFPPHMPYMESNFGGGMPFGGHWGAPPQPNPFGPSSLPGSNYNMGGWPNHGNFGPMNQHAAIRSSQPRSVAVRLMLCNACKNLEGSTVDGFHSLPAIRDQIERMNAPGDGPISDKELLDLCETEGSPHNGGGNFQVREDVNGMGMSIRYEPDIQTHGGGGGPGRPIGAPGEIGSPVVGPGQMHRSFGPPPGIPMPY